MPASFAHLRLQPNQPEPAQNEEASGSGPAGEEEEPEGRPGHPANTRIQEPLLSFRRRKQGSRVDLMAAENFEVAAFAIA